MKALHYEAIGDIGPAGHGVRDQMGCDALATARLAARRSAGPDARRRRYSLCLDVSEIHDRNVRAAERSGKLRA